MLTVTRVVAAGLVVVTLLVGAAAAATTPPTFLKTEYPFLGNNHIVADLNGDGRPDLAGTGGPAAAVRLNNGTGAFGPRVDYPIGGNGQDLAAGDLNGDGRLDLVVTINSPELGLAVLIGNGDGTFAAPVTYPNTAGADAPAVVTADLDNDARLDVVAAHQMACYVASCTNSFAISVWMGNGDGSLAPAREVEVGRGIAAVAVADFNRDGNKDLAIAGDSGRLYRLHGLGDGTFVQQPTLTITAETGFVNGSDVDVADFNRDGIEDLVVAMASNGSYTVILIGNGDGTFRPPHVIQEPELLIPEHQAVADFNGDGFQDLALSLAWGLSALLEVLNGNGDGTFQPRRLYLPPPPESSGGGAIVAADLNGDGKPDLTLGRRGAFPGFLVLLNSTGAAPPPTPSAPTLLSPAQDATVSQPVTLDWSDVSAAATYRVQVDDTNNFTAPLQRDQSVTVSQLTVSSLAARQHFWRVRAINAAGTAGPWSTVRRFTPQVATTPASLSAVSVSPSTVTGGMSATGTVTLTSAAPSGGFAVSLSSSASVASVPASVSVAQGATSATFAISTSTVAASTSATITATAGGVVRTATLTVAPQAQPPPPPGETAVLTVTATGRSGERVTSSPAGINVAVGSSGSASFAVGTVITLSATNGRDVVWSGACSSGDDKTRTCRFTLNGAASVTANVQ